MFSLDRVYGERNPKTGLVEWFFTAREGIFGPYISQKIASQTLDEFKKACIANSLDGGRKLNNGFKLSILPLDSNIYGARQRKAG